MLNTSEYWIKTLELIKHPEGGYYKEIYRSDENIPNQGLPKRYSGVRSFSTAIYFLLKNDDFSAFHLIKSDETWHFYKGCSLTLYLIDENSNLKEVYIGDNPQKEQVFQFTIPHNTWFAASLNNEINENDFSLIGCTVAPGFDFRDFKLGERDKLIDMFPQYQSLIIKHTH